MSSHICKFCGKEFNYSSKLIKHQQRPQCRNYDVIVTTITDNPINNCNKYYECNKCNYITKYRYNLNRHNKTCVKLDERPIMAEPEPKVNNINDELREMIRTELAAFKDQIKLEIINALGITKV
jgi:hypothetical protein